jgi:cytosine/adenosine deaminase-related metal-dependent hydrolase
MPSLIPRFPHTGGPEADRGLRIVRARTILAAPAARAGTGRLDNGAAAVVGGRVAAVGGWPDIHRSHGGRDVPVEDLGEVVLAPGLVNAHVHLELCRLRGRTVLGRGFEAWVRSLLGLLAAGPGPDDAEQAALDAALAEMRASGTACAADVCTRRPAFVSAGLDRAGLEYVLFYEWFGHRFDRPSGPAGQGAGESAQEGDGLPWPAEVAGLPEAVRVRRLAAGGHALYSTSADALRAAKDWDRARGKPFTLHLAEHQGEAEFLRAGAGEFGAMLRERVVPRDWRPPGLSPVAYADSLGLLDGSTLAVHCVHLGDGDIDLLARSGATACLCPRSNQAIGAGRAPWSRLAEAGVPLCLGTDSLASNADLDLWNEARSLLAHWPGLRPADVLAMMTVTPARVLGLAGDLGAVAPGRLARFAVVPDDLAAELA